MSKPLPDPIRMSERQIRELISSKLASVLALDQNDISFSKSFDDYGLDSVDGLIVVSLVEEQLQVELPPELFIIHRTIDEVMAALLDQIDTSQCGQKTALP